MTEDQGKKESEELNTRLDITASLMKEWTESEKQLFVDTVESQPASITTVHLSGLHLHSVLSTEQIETLVKSIGKIKSVTELFVFQGGSTVLTEDLLALSLPPNLQVIILWQFRAMPNTLAVAIRRHPTLSRVTLNLPCPRSKQLEWGCLDFYAMAFCSMEHLRVLQIRCIPTGNATYTKQMESIITPEAVTLLLNSTSIQHLYLENCGLLDDHMDIVMLELPQNKTLTTLDLKDNLFTDDCLYTTGRLLPVLPPQVTMLDISGADISDDAGRAVAAGMAKNLTLQSLELEGTLARFHDEFAVPDGHSGTEWMRDIAHQLRLNRAYAAAANHRQPHFHRWTNNNNAASTSSSTPSFARSRDAIQTNASAFVVAVSAVSDNVSCLYHFLRAHPSHCDRLTVPPPHVEPLF